MHKSIFLSIVSLFLVQSAFAQSDRMIDEIKNHREGTKIWWAGHNSWIIKSGDLVVTTDIFLQKKIESIRCQLLPKSLLK